jgi:hypothetical protein
MSETDNVVAFERDLPTSKLKPRNPDKANCRHRKIWVSQDEPMVECVQCGSVVDPYAWIRAFTADWNAIQMSHELFKKAAAEEQAEIKRKLRQLRKEYASEAERLRDDREVMVMPARERV